MSDDAEEDQPRPEPSSLHDLPLDTAIRLRWVLRDIRAGRTKLLAPSRDDLTLLAELDLISVDNDKLVLTDSANSIIGSHK
jgi:hypothetical protein